MGKSEEGTRTLSINSTGIYHEEWLYIFLVLATIIVSCKNSNDTISEESRLDPFTGNAVIEKLRWPFFLLGTFACSFVTYFWALLYFGW